MAGFPRGSLVVVDLAIELQKIYNSEHQRTDCLASGRRHRSAAWRRGERLSGGRDRGVSRRNCSRAPGGHRAFFPTSSYVASLISIMVVAIRVGAGAANHVVAVCSP
jgi:hypothetical protein